MKVSTITKIAAYIGMIVVTFAIGTLTYFTLSEIEISKTTIPCKAVNISVDYLYCDTHKSDMALCKLEGTEIYCYNVPYKRLENG